MHILCMQQGNLLCIFYYLQYSVTKDVRFYAHCTLYVVEKLFKQQPPANSCQILNIDFFQEQLLHVVIRCLYTCTYITGGCISEYVPQYTIAIRYCIICRCSSYVAVSSQLYVHGCCTTKKETNRTHINKCSLL